MTLNICTSKTHYESGRIVRIFILLRNTAPTSLQMSSITDGVFITDPNGRPIMRLAGFECFGGTGDCILSANSTRDFSVNWNMSDTFTAATVSGAYTIHVSFSACPTNGSCLETVDTQLTIRITLTALENNALS
jgi:hypothetical protein